MTGSGGWGIVGHMKKIVRNVQVVVEEVLEMRFSVIEDFLTIGGCGCLIDDRVKPKTSLVEAQKRRRFRSSR